MPEAGGVSEMNVFFDYGPASGAMLLKLGMLVNTPKRSIVIDFDGEFFNAANDLKNTCYWLYGRESMRLSSASKNNLYGAVDALSDKEPPDVDGFCSELKQLILDIPSPEEYIVLVEMKPCFPAWFVNFILNLKGFTKCIYSFGHEKLTQCLREQKGSYRELNLPFKYG